MQCQQESTHTLNLDSKELPRGIGYVAAAPFLLQQGFADQVETLNQGFPHSILLSGCAVNKGAKAAVRLELPFLPL